MSALLLGACAADDEDIDAEQQAELSAILAKDVDPTTAAEATDPADLDQDGIPDALEEQLIRRYRPYYELTKEGNKTEAHLPSDAIAEIETSQLKEMKGDDDVSAPLAGCGNARDKHLVPAQSLLTCKPETSYTRNKKITKYCLNHADARRAGVSVAEAKAKATGLYGHVSNDLVNGRATYKIEYWQYWAFNDQDITVLGLGSFGDHEGDWTGVEVWVDRETKAVAKLGYMIHGIEVFFTVPAGTKAACTSCFTSVKGAKYNPSVGSIFDDRERPKFDDNQAEFWIDAQGFEHVKLYIERGGHEGWPGTWGKAEHKAGPITIKLNAHSGGGVGWLVADVKDRAFNLGEVAHPLTTAARVIIDFNGHWGCTNAKDVFGLGPQRRSPVGPAMHCEWRWPDGKSVPGCAH
ncbi:MAG: hypothetical protein KIT84_33550 [Labilithrix sp.]|nr:hypothetical protein [Labilithrix sp.]MCW5815973.1 hypothetical protein [Labilithrix sp.]